MKKFFITIPHSSTKIPSRFKKRINSKANIKEMCEPGLYKLCDWKGIKRIYLDIHECIINVNRNRNNIDPKTNKIYPKTRQVFPQKDFNGIPIFLKNAGLTKKEKKELLEKYYDKFFDKIWGAIASKKFDFFVDLHLMNSNKSGYEMDKPRTDICIGNLGNEKGDIVNGRPSTTFPAKLVRILKQRFEKKGYSCSLNRPFAGGYIILSNFGKFPCIQLEINKRILLTKDDGKIIKEKLETLSKDLFEILKLQ